MRPRSGAPFEGLGHEGEAYLRYARPHPLKYPLMFNTPFPTPEQHIEMLAEAQFAFSPLETLPLRGLHHPIADVTRYGAVFAWPALHGLTSLRQSDAPHGAPGQVPQCPYLKGELGVTSCHRSSLRSASGASLFRV